MVSIFFVFLLRINWEWWVTGLNKIRIVVPQLGSEEENAVLEVLRTRHIASGPKVREFEEKFSKYIGVKHAIAVANGTVALDLLLKSAGIKQGDEVITSPFSFIATANSILFQGAKPVFVDIDPETFNLDPEKVKEAITPRTRAILVVHLYGHPADMDALSEIAEDHNLLLLEDAAQAHGSEYKGEKTGSLGDGGAFSFYATKNMTTGEGGMIVTNSDEIARRARLLRNHGQESKYFHVELGYNYRMTDIAAAIGIVQLGKLDYLNNRRRKNASLLTSGLKGAKGIVAPIEKSYARHVYHQYVIRVKYEDGINREKLISFLDSKGIETAIHYPMIIPEQPLYRRLGIKCYNSCENAISASREVLSLPVHPGLAPEEINYMINTIHEALEEL